MAWTNFQQLDPAQAKCNSDRYTGVPHSADNADGTWHGYRQGDELVGAVLVTPSAGKLASIAAAKQVRDDTEAAIVALLQQVKPACTAVIKHARGTGAAPSALQVSRAIAGIIGYLKLTSTLSDET